MHRSLQTNKPRLAAATVKNSVPYANTTNYLHTTYIVKTRRRKFSSYKSIIHRRTCSSLPKSTARKRRERALFSTCGSFVTWRGFEGKLFAPLSHRKRDASNARGVKLQVRGNKNVTKGSRDSLLVVKERVSFLCLLFLCGWVLIIICQVCAILALRKKIKVNIYLYP